jgi:quinol monooxygenase YgiN
MIGVIATLKVKEGNEADFESVMKRLMEAVNANEDGCSLYALHKGEDPQTYVMMERYNNQDALTAHSQTSYFKEIGAEMAPFLAGRPDVRVLPEV